ncbi:cytochrome P450 [Streptoalloteichus hindustanus]|uniref:Cytochrome P450 n=1 Tax=Streptoalloteichus hindustanus TaxID=2017 RepID=A0A1M5P673_STRHI|nr:cytochrome P450 [Streptoalloteichus hindustanus]SHG96929.1 Cytochrome P450 [Streptoalloteichus hindustanus]
MSARQDPVPYPFGPRNGLELDPAYAGCRSRAGLTRVRPPFGDEAWLVTRHGDLRAVLRDPRFSRAVAVRRDEPRMSPCPLKTSVLSLDPPNHTEVRRRIVAALAFTGGRIERLRPQVERLAHRLIDDMTRHGAPVDFDEWFSVPLAGGIGCALLGVPYADRAMFRSWLVALATNTLPPPEFEERVAAVFDYMGGLLARRRREPRDDVLSALVEVSDGTRLAGLSLVELASDLLLAVFDNTSAQLGNVVYLLLREPDHVVRLRQRPELLAPAIEELLRLAPFPAHATFARYATEDVEVGGTTVRAGEAILPALPAGNFDDTVFPSPRTAIFDRPRNPHLSFGYGTHHCLGGPLVRMLMRTAIHALLSRLPGIRLAVPGERVPWRVDLEVRRVAELPVAW